MGAPSALSSLHVGMGWYEEQPGGLNRMVANLFAHLPGAGVGAHALVAGSPEVASWSEGPGRSFAPLTVGPLQRAWRAAVALRAEVERSRPDVLERTYRIDPALIRVVPGGVDLDRFRPEPSRHEARRALGLPNDRPIVLTVRRLARRMGLPDLIAACSAARRHVPELLLAIAGGGPLRGELERQIDELDLADHVRLLGRVSDADLPLLYRAADLSIVPSTALEGFGLICVESLASGTPAMVTPVGGLPEVVRDLEPALVLEEMGPGAIAEGIVTALRGGRPLPASADCVAYARERFAWPAIARRIGGAYEEAVR